MENGGSSQTLANTGANGARPSKELVVKHEGRKPLFTAASNSRDRLNGARANGIAQASPRLKTARQGTSDGTPGRTGASKLGLGLLRRTKSESLAALSQPKENTIPNGDGNRRDSNSSGGMSPASPGGTRIPRPTSSFSSLFQPRNPLSIVDAYKRAVDEQLEAQAIDGSPSPAPRSWRARNARDEAKVRQMLAQDHLDTKARDKALPQDSDASRPRTSPSKQAADSAPGQGPDLGVGLGRSPERDKSLAAPSHRHGSDNSSHGIPDLVPGIEDIPLPSVEAGQRGIGRSPRRSDPKSPEKSFAWEIEDDFTAGDLQISESPRIRVNSNRPFAHRPSLLSTGEGAIKSPARLTQPGSKNSKLDEIRARELKSTSQLLAERPLLRHGNTKLDEIRARERAVEKQIPIPDHNQPRPKNTKLDEIRRLEAKGLSKRAYAATRLEEIMEQNAMSRSVSPEEARPRSSQKEQPQLRTNTPAPRQESRLPTRAKASFETAGEKIPDTPITVYKSQREQGANGNEPPKGAADKESSSARDSHDLLRRLAKATSASPAPEVDKSEKRQLDPQRGTGQDEEPQLTSILTRPLDKNRRATTAAVSTLKDAANSKPTVGFTGLRRSDSLESVESKRSSIHSESDPVPRIEGEKELFALNENQSERGSLHVPSRPSSSHSDDDGLGEPTPRVADKNDFGSMPTPRVTGAYVETPATARFDRRLDGRESRKRFPDKQAAGFDGDAHGLDGRGRDTDTASDPGTSDYTRHDKAASAAGKLRKRRRTQSLPRRKLPLKNTAKLPSAKDDLLELQRKHNFDDSTVDNFDDVMMGRRNAGKAVELTVKPESASSSDEQLQSKREDEEPSDEDGNGESPDTTVTSKQAAIARMGKSLLSAFNGVRDAKYGIEKLEDQVAVIAKSQPPLVTIKETGSSMVTDTPVHICREDVKHEKDCPSCMAGPSPVAVAYLRVPIPRLYYSTPRFRLSLLGLGLLILSLWMAFESAMCVKFCRPRTCSTGDCVYSLDDPTFGSALPVKLDQWTTGGYGRDITGWAWETAQDLWADAEDVLLGRSAADVPMQGMSFAQKQQHRRRLAKRGLQPTSLGGAAAPEERAKWEAWRRTRREQERVREAREMGYYDTAGERDSSAVIGDDERVG
ncbi:hypothetical protein HIM_09290 [Hirsutella minnesotensis 3608]|uniref:Uncharacterized protein n=1 Tax=Hirsutella minnesotensis 3608 TaxID=1043627 RepID=A0A0F7ZGQ8_9HYPO|nr:hypothetical protein HIM_09290 [Hirsutella minnesotensis 3608]